MSKIRFTKMHGCGNDYIYVDTSRYAVKDPAALSVRLSRPHFGVGSDGLILIGRGDGSATDFTMRIFNADGSEAMMCGNGARCVARYVADHGLTAATSIRLGTLSGIKTLTLNADRSVTVGMGAPRLECAEQYTGSAPQTVEAEGRMFEGTFVSMGNPHFVIFTPLTGFDVARYGQALEHDALFPERANIEFAEVRQDGTIRMRVWERGSGITLACGTGACATLVAAAVTGRTDRQATVSMDGGDVTVCWTDREVTLSGPATTVFEGELEE